MLKSLKFTDLYLGKEVFLLAGVPGTKDPVPVPVEHLEEIVELREKCEAIMGRRGSEDFPVQYAGVAYRVSLIHSLYDTVFVLRRFGDEVPLLPQLGIHPRIVENLMDHDLTGLVVIAGAFGHGKTTTASSVVVSRINQYGGIAVTIENPPEMPLEGRHGEGVCYQTWVEKGEFAEACRKATRWAPSIIFLGEIRDNETAIEALRASINGRLIICTTHAENPVMAIERIHALASGASSSSEDVAHLLSAGLAGVVHQELEKQPDRAQLYVKSLWVAGSDAHGIRSTIAAKRFMQLNSIIDQQKAQMLNSRSFVK